jgi:transcription initiation factor TFIID subunit 7
MAGIKLKLNTVLPKEEPNETPNPSAVPAAFNDSSIAATPGGSIPAATPGGGRPKIKFKSKSSGSAATTPAGATPKTSKAGRASKPSAKILESRKAIGEESDDDGTTINVAAPAKQKLMLTLGGAPKTPSTPVVLKAKVKGKPPKRPLGDGYDSEASDREIDPAIEEQFVIRMIPGDDCDYMHQMITEKKFGVPKSQGGADFHMRFFDGDGRRAAVTVRGHHYAATLVDLPTIIEGMKSWDKRGWWKSADICQMLLVFAPIKKEEEAKTIDLPREVDQQTYQYPHGLTPPMHNARKRRFRKRISRGAIEAVEDAVEKLLEADAKANSTKYEMVDLDAPKETGDEGSQASYDYDEDAEGELDDNTYFNTIHHPAPADDMAADLEADLEKAFDEVSVVPTPSAATPSMNVGTPSAVGGEPEEDSGDESLEDEDEDEDAMEVDENERARLAQLQGTKEDIADLERQIVNVQAQHAQQSNPILKKRLEDNIRKLKAELQLKKSSLGEAEED